VPSLPKASHHRVFRVPSAKGDVCRPHSSPPHLPLPLTPCARSSVKHLHELTTGVVMRHLASLKPSERWSIDTRRASHLVNRTIGDRERPKIWCRRYSSGCSATCTASIDEEVRPGFIPLRRTWPRTSCVTAPQPLGPVQTIKKNWKLTIGRCSSRIRSRP
jgi:hypothetical protein